MAKVVFLLSCDEPVNLLELIESVGELFNQGFHLQPNSHLWVGTKKSADAVLNIIGVD